MARGQFWQTTYDPQSDPPTNIFDWKIIDTNAGPVNQVIPGIAKISKVKRKIFNKCDFKEKYSEFTFDNCEFQSCDFDYGSWEKVKFSNCMFSNCNMSLTEFNSCTFLKCKFKNISVSADHLRFENTTIQPSIFLKSISTNLDHLPPKSDKNIQNIRLKITTYKVAKTILQSTRNEPDPDLFFEAHKEFTIRGFSAKRAEIKLNNFKKSSYLIMLLCFPAFIDGIISILAGFLTNWGRSIIRPIFFVLIVTAIFSIVYFYFPDANDKLLNEKYNYFHVNTIGYSVVKSIDISLVAGYSKYNNPSRFEIVRILHLLLGIYWYSLIVPVIIRRIHR